MNRLKAVPKSNKSIITNELPSVDILNLNRYICSGVLISKKDPRVNSYIKKLNINIKDTLRKNGARKEVTKKKLKAYMEDKNYYIIPKYMGFPMGDKSMYDVSYPVIPDIKFKDKCVLNESQVIPFEEASELSSCILSLPPGCGKSYVAAKLIPYHKKKTLIIVHTTAIMSQWIEVIKNCCGITPGVYYGEEKRDGDIVIAVVNSATSVTFKINNIEMKAKEWYSQFGFVIIDEAHLYLTESKINVLFKSQFCPKVIALTATLPEEPELTNVLPWLFGPIVKSNVNTDIFKTVVHTYKFHVSHLEVYRYADDSIDYHNTLVHTLIDPNREELITKIISNCENNLLVFVKYRNHAKRIYDLVRVNLGCTCEIPITSPEDIMNEVSSNPKGPNFNLTENECTCLLKDTVVFGGTSSEVLNQTTSNSRIIITTYPYFAVGISIPRMTDLLLASPVKTNLKQIIGRIQRLGADNTDTTRVIHDIIDGNSLIKNQYNVRRQYYESMKYPINNMTNML